MSLLKWLGVEGKSKKKEDWKQYMDDIDTGNYDVIEYDDIVNKHEYEEPDEDIEWQCDCDEYIDDQDRDGIPDYLERN